MSEPNLIRRSGAADYSLFSGPEAPRLRLADPPAQISEALFEDGEQVIEELAQAQLLIQHQSDRILDLERALDESLSYLEELRHQRVDQEFLEAQLASTEEVANIQQQAIAQLKSQLARQQPSNCQSPNSTEEQQQLFQSLLVAAESVAQAQQVELERLRRQLSHDRSEIQAYQKQLEHQLDALQAALRSQQQHELELENQTLSARTLAVNLEHQLEQAQTQIRELNQQLGNRQSSLAYLEDQLRQAHHALAEQETLINSLRQAGPKPHPRVTARERELATAQNKIADLEARLTRQATTQAMLQHACQELEEARDRQQLRVTELEQQQAEMQEQILHQARQGSEYETAIQHWKDRYLALQQQGQQLQRLLANLPDLPPEIAEQLAAFQEISADALAPSTFPLPSPAHKIDLPDFLARRRSYRRRQENLGSS